MEVESNWDCKFGCALITFQLVIEVFMYSFEIWNWSRDWWFEAKIG
jgi:hypothetical protein